MTLSEKAINRLVHSHTMDELNDMYNQQLNSIVEKCRNIKGGEQLMEDASWTLLIRRYGFAMIKD